MKHVRATFGTALVAAAVTVGTATAAHAAAFSACTPDALACAGVADYTYRPASSGYVGYYDITVSGPRANDQRAGDGWVSVLKIEQTEPSIGTFRRNIGQSYDDGRRRDFSSFNDYTVKDVRFYVCKKRLSDGSEGSCTRLYRI